MSPLSPSRSIGQSSKTPTVITTTITTPPVTAYLPPHSRAQSVNRTSIHKRNSSLDSSRYTPTTVMSTSLQANQLNNYLIDNKLQQQQQQQQKHQKQQQQQHSRHNSYDGMLTQRPTTNNNNIKYSHFDQTDDDEYESMPSRGTTLPERQQSIKQQHHQNMTKQQQQSPIKRSSSFNIKAQEIQSPARNAVTSGTPKMHNKFVKTVSAPVQTMKIQKSASSSCFKQITNAIDDDDDDYGNEFYINPDDDLNPNQFTPSDESEEEQKYSLTMANDPPISNTRYNKTFLMRCEQSKNKVAGKVLGVIACPNTPELPRRASARDRASMPRDSSLGRILDRKTHSAGGVSSSNATKSTNVSNVNSNSNSAPTTGKVTSKYLDISKYKPEKGNNFLKRDESKSYLNREVKKSSSSACLQNFQRDVARASTRSTGGGNSRPSSASATKKKEGK